jgi:hypothetical protein
MVGEQCVMLTCLPSWFSKTLCAVVVMANGDDSFDSADAGRLAVVVMLAVVMMRLMLAGLAVVVLLAVVMMRLMLAGLAVVVKLAVVMMRLMLAGLAVVVMLAVEGREHHDEYHGHRSGVRLLLTSP